MKFLKIPYWYLLIGPYALFMLGFAMNAIVMSQNGGQMPVQFPGGYPEGDSDIIHCAMTHATHLKVLADWIVIKSIGVASPGDILEFAYDVSFLPALSAWFALVIKDHNL